MSSPGNLLLTSDFNFHENDPSDGIASQFRIFSIGLMSIKATTSWTLSLLDLVKPLYQNCRYMIQSFLITMRSTTINLAIKRSPTQTFTVTSCKLFSIDSDSSHSDIVTMHCTTHHHWILQSSAVSYMILFFL